MATAKEVFEGIELEFGIPVPVILPSKGEDVDITQEFHPKAEIEGTKVVLTMFTYSFTLYQKGGEINGFSLSKMHRELRQRFVRTLTGLIFGPISEE